MHAPKSQTNFWSLLLHGIFTLLFHLHFYPCYRSPSVSFQSGSWLVQITRQFAPTSAHCPPPVASLPSHIRPCFTAIHMRLINCSRYSRSGPGTTYHLPYRRAESTMFTFSPFIFRSSAWNCIVQHWSYYLQSPLATVTRAIASCVSLFSYIFISSLLEQPPLPRHE